MAVRLLVNNTEARHGSRGLNQNDAVKHQVPIAKTAFECGLARCDGRFSGHLHPQSTKGKHLSESQTGPFDLILAIQQVSRNGRRILNRLNSRNIGAQQSLSSGKFPKEARLFSDLRSRSLCVASIAVADPSAMQLS